jgi:hypothetical protein
MVRTRSTDLGRKNPPPERGGPSNNKHMVALEARIAQMSRDMKALIEQNLQLLHWISEESNIYEGEDESNGQNDGHPDGNTNPDGRGAPRDNQPGDNFQNDGGERSLRQRKKKRLSEVVASLGEKYNRLQKEVHQKEKGKTSLEDNLLHGTASHFINQISVVLHPKKFKVPSIITFTRIKDPTEHLDNYRAHMDLHGTSTVVACRAFPLTLFGSARDWFRKLPPKSIDSFNDLGRNFLGNGRTPSSSIQDLVGVYGKSGGVHKQGRNPSTHCWLPTDSSVGVQHPYKKKKKPQVEQTTEAKPCKQFKDYNFTPSMHRFMKF